MLPKEGKQHGKAVQNEQALNKCVTPLANLDFDLNVSSFFLLQENYANAASDASKGTMENLIQKFNQNKYIIKNK